MFDMGGFAGITQAVADLKGAAAKGFTISDDGAQQLISALQEVHDKVTAALAKGSYLGRELPLGSTPAAKVYAPFLATVWTDPVQGGHRAFSQLQKDLEDAMDTIKKNSASYQAAEAANADSLKTI